MAGWDLASHWQLEIGYLYQYQPLPSGIVGEMNHALQVTISSTAPFRKKLHRE